MSTIYVTHPRYVEHDMPQHPEHAGRIRAVWQVMESSGLLATLKPAEAPLLAEAPILKLHAEEYIQLLRKLEQFQRTVRLDADTYACPTSYEIARYSAGGVVHAVDAVMKGDADNGLAAVRPPGHHAVADRAMGFCLLGNIAIAARYAQQTYGIERVLIVDYDVHHGNGTEAMFYDDPSVLFVSTHQERLYPLTGAVRDVGIGAGEGATLNIPMPGGCGDENYARVFDEIILPAARRFQPQLILVSVGHDAHWTDPLALMRLSLDGYAALAQKMIDLAAELCGGKVVFVMEGGYNLDALANGMTNIARLLVGHAPQDPLGAPPDRQKEPDITRLIEQVRVTHRL